MFTSTHGRAIGGGHSTRSATCARADHRWRDFRLQGHSRNHELNDTRISTNRSVAVCRGHGRVQRPYAVVYRSARVPFRCRIWRRRARSVGAATGQIGSEKLAPPALSAGGAFCICAHIAVWQV